MLTTRILVLRARMQDAGMEYVGSRISTVYKDGYNQLTSTSVGTFTHHKLSNQEAGKPAPYNNAGEILLSNQNGVGYTGWQLANARFAHFGDWLRRKHVLH